MIYEFSPKQDLHGYSKPWAPGANINILNAVSDNIIAYLSNFTFENGVVITTGGTLMGFVCKVNPESPYTFSVKSSPNNVLLRVREYADLPTSWEDASYIKQPINISGPTASFTSSETTEYVICGFYQDANPTGVRVENFQLEAGSTASPYSPYANICPMEGYNIWDPSQDQMIQVYSGYVDAEARKMYLHPVYEEYDGEELVGPWMSSMDEYTEEGTPTTSAFVVDFGGEVTEYNITDFQLQTLLDSLGIRRFITSGAMLLNSLMDQALGRVRSEEELMNRSFPIHVIAIGDELPKNLIIKKSDVLPGLPGKFIR